MRIPAADSRLRRGTSLKATAVAVATTPVTRRLARGWVCPPKGTDPGSALSCRDVTGTGGGLRMSFVAGARWARAMQGRREPRYETYRGGRGRGSVRAQRVPAAQES